MLQSSSGVKITRNRNVSILIVVHRWEETTVVDLARHPSELVLKEAIHIHMTPLRNGSTGTQDLSSLDAGWPLSEGRETGPTRHPLMDLAQTVVTTSDVVYSYKN